MTPRATLTARARTDLAEARLWYARIRIELADEFIDDVDQTIAAIRERLKSFPEVECGVRRALCATFPYKIYFRQGRDEIRVLAVYHVSRDPRKWNRRR